jgi:ribosomal protein S18 acetylase RimI-like enzyme
VNDQPRVVVRPLAATDLDFVIRQHRLHFPHGFFARLGENFLREYYRGYLTGGSGIAWAIEFEGRLAGYLVGTTDPQRHRDHVIRRHGRRLTAQAALGLLRHPGLAGLFLRTRARRYARKLLARALRRRRTRTATRPTVTDVAVLSHVVVAPSAQGLGLGSWIIDQFVSAAASSGCREVVLVTASGGRASAYYRRRGWTLVNTHTTPDGLPLDSYSLRISDKDHIG